MTNNEEYRQTIVNYLRIYAPPVSDEESDALDAIRVAFSKLSPILKMGIVSELAGTLYQEELRRQ